MAEDGKINIDKFDGVTIRIFRVGYVRLDVLIVNVDKVVSSHVGVFCWEVWVEVVEWCGGGGVEGRMGEKGALQLAGKTVAGATVVGLNVGERRVSLARFHLWSLSLKRLVAMARKWQNLAALGRKRIAPPRAVNVNDTTAVDKGCFVVYSCDGVVKSKPISIYCDNTGAIAIAKDDGVTKGARHFRAKVHYLHETIKLGDVKIEKTDTDDNLVDPFTKALAFPKHSEMTWNIGLLPASKDTNPSIDTSLNHKEDDQEINEPQSDINPICKSSRTRCAPDRMCLYIDAEEHELGDLGEPANYKAALLDPESKKWLDAMNVGMLSMKDNDVWVLVELPLNAITVGSKWLFKKKTDMDGAIYIFKARLVAKGFTQTYGVDYEETISPIAYIRAIRILIAIAAYYDYEIWQMDVKTAFLNRHLSEEVYMEQPEGFVNPKYPNHVCKLKRSIYGLKQASRQWNKRFDDEIKKFGFTQNPVEPCVYIKSSGSYIAILILYVDDILLMGNNILMLQDVKSYLRRSFAMKDLGEAAYILGIKIYRDRSKPLIGSIMYAVRCTRPNVAFAQNMTSRFQQNPGNMERKLRVSCYTDAGYLTDADNLKSQTGYVFVLNGGVVDWKSTKQSIFATSSTDAEYIAAFDASKEAVWI
nr:hypothetical protein [Tanacetum cinerariifolium]